MEPEARSLAQVDLNLLKALDALLQERGVTRAAERLSIQQPSMSAALARLRVLFADELLIRTGRSMSPTPFAQQLGPHIERILGEIEELVAPNTQFDPRHAAHTFTVLATDYTALVLIQPLMAALATEAPDVRIQLESRDLAGHGARLQKGDIDLAIVPARFSRATALPKESLFTDRFVAAAWRENHEVSDPLTFEELDRLPYLTYKLGPVESMVDSLLTELGHPRQADTIVESFLVGPLLLRGSRQITFLQERLARQLADVAELRLMDAPFDIPTLVETMTWHARASNDAAHTCCGKGSARSPEPSKWAVPPRAGAANAGRTSTVDSDTPRPPGLPRLQSHPRAVPGSKCVASTGLAVRIASGPSLVWLGNKGSLTCSPAELLAKAAVANPLERFNREIGRRTAAVSIFPDEKSVIGLV